MNHPTGERTRPRIRTSLHWFLFALTLGWILYAFRQYLPDLTAGAIAERFFVLRALLVRLGFRDFPLLLLMLLASYLLGRKFLETLKVRTESALERFCLCSGTGIAGLSLIVFLLAATRSFYKPVAYGVLILPLLLWFRELRSLVVSAWNRPRPAPAVRPVSFERLGYFFLILYAALCLGIALLAALGPEIEYDPLAIHLAAAKAVAESHRLAALPDIPQTFFPRHITLLYSFGILLHNEITAKLINYLLGVLTILTTGALAARVFSRHAGWVAAGILISTPSVLWEMKTAHVDLGCALFVALSLYAATVWLLSNDNAWFRLAVFFTAFSLGTKYQALFALGSLSAVIFLDRLLRQRDGRRAAADSLRFFLPAVAGLVPWGIVNLVQTGNPVFPFFNGVFHSPYWSPAQTETALDQMRSAGIPVTFANPWVVFTGFWEMTVDQMGNFYGNVGPFYLILLPLLLFQRRLPRPVKLLLGFGFFYWLFWLFTGQHLRYFLGALPALAVVAAQAATEWLRWVQARTRPILAVAAATILAALAVFNSPLFEKYGAHARYGNPLMEKLPLDYLLGRQSRDDYLSEHVMDYPLIQYFNRLPGRNKLLFWWNDPAPAVFYLRGQAAYAWSRFVARLYVEDTQQLLAVLRENQVTHLLIGEMDQGATFLTDPERDFVRRHLERLYRRNALVLYRFSAEPISQEGVSYDFLNHIEDARMSLPAWAATQPNPDFRVITPVGEDTRYAMLTYPPAEVDFALALPSRPLLRFALGRKYPPCLEEGSFHVSVVPENGERHTVFQRTLAAVNSRHDLGWYEQEVDLSVYANQRVHILFQAHADRPKACNWYLWANPVIISLP